MRDPILEAIAACNPNEALEPGDPRFVDFDPLRRSSIHIPILRSLEAAGSRKAWCHLTFAGPRGCGKSTELNRVIANVREHGYLPLTASIAEIVDPSEVTLGDVFRTLVRLLSDHCGVHADEDPELKVAFDSVARWFAEIIRARETELKVEKSAGLDFVLGGGVEGEASVGFAKIKGGLGKVMGHLARTRKSTDRRFEQIRETVESSPRDLVDNLNLLLRAIHTRESEACPNGIVFIVDAVDRCPPDLVNRVFLRNSDLLRRIEAHVIFTVPLSLLYSPIEGRLEDRFQCVTLPMLPVFEVRSRNPNEAVVQALIEAMHRRVPADLFAEPELLRDLILASGGCWRDLLRLAESALLQADAKVRRVDVERAISAESSGLARMITEEEMRILAKTYSTYEIDPTETGRKLLFLRCVLEYNGDNWVSVHPLLERAKPFQDARKEVETIARAS